MNQHCQNARDHLAVAESGDSKTAAYRRAAEEIEKAILEDNLTHAQTAKQIGKSETYVRILLKALYQSRAADKEFVIDWSSGTNKRSELALRPAIPARRDDKVELATQLLNDPIVAQRVLDSRTRASSNIHTAVTNRNTENRERLHAFRERQRQAGAVPISGLHTKIADTIGGWSNALMDIEDDLVESRDQIGANIVATALRMHADTCTRLADRIQLDVDAAIESGHRGDA
jgi:hypothetical protein